jgi:hypothetical protein
MREKLDVVDENINKLLCIGRHIWDMGCFVFDGDPIYELRAPFR